MSGGTMKDNSTTATPEAWKMRFLANGTSGTWFYTDDITVTDAWLRAHPDDVEVIPLCRIPPRQHSHEQHIEELRAALARMLHMHHMMLPLMSLPVMPGSPHWRCTARHFIPNGPVAMHCTPLKRRMLANFLCGAFVFLTEIRRRKLRAHDGYY